MDFKLPAEIIDFSAFTPEQWAAHDARIAAEREKEAADAEAQRRAEWERKRPGVLLAAGVPPRKLNKATMPEYDESNPAWLAVAGLRLGGDSPVRVLAGPKGCGKTTAAVRWLYTHGGPRPAFSTAAAFVAAGRFDREYRQRWEGATAMVLDDIGVEFADAKGSFLSDLDEFVNHWAESYGVLICTTNSSQAEFKARFGERISSRVRESVDPWHSIAGLDLRGVR